ncbi:HAD family phosphatase [Candidatus Woesebacteria bacterium]|nr:HAD family phosphatase [Candidatus Woesebacteria bacterium]
MNLAFFDVDYTLYKGFTTIQFFYAFANKYHLTDLITERKQMEAEIEAGTIDQHRLTQWSMGLSAKVVAGLSVEEVAAQVRTTVKAEGEFFPWAMDLLEFLRKKQFKIYLISASIEPMIAEIATELGVERYFSTILEVKDGVYTGQRANVRNGQSKLDALNQVIDEISEENNVIAFGDSDGDVPMLAAADIGFVVDPIEYSDKILAAATEHGWPVLKHETAFEQVRQALESEFSIK